MKKTDTVQKISIDICWKYMQKREKTSTREIFAEKAKKKQRICPILDENSMNLESAFETRF